MQFSILTLTHPRDGIGNFRRVRADFRPTRRGQNQNGQSPSLEPLLIAQVLIGGDQ
jgi:hypothetical protein